MPPYPDLVAAQLEKTYGSKVTLQNRAIAGWSVGPGREGPRQPAEGEARSRHHRLRHERRRRPQSRGLQGGDRNPAAADQGRNAATEVILVASMLGNPEWAATPPEMFPKYRDALASLKGPGVVLADMTAVWQELLERKRYHRPDRQRGQPPQRLRPPALRPDHPGLAGGQGNGHPPRSQPALIELMAESGALIRLGARRWESIGGAPQSSSESRSPADSGSGTSPLRSPSTAKPVCGPSCCR